MRLKPNPFVSATLYHESKGEHAGYGYFGKDIYGKFHKSPVLYKTEAEARDAMKKRMLRRNPPNQGLFFVTFKFQGRRVYLAQRRAGGGFTTKKTEAQVFWEVEAIKQADHIRGAQVLRLSEADVTKYGKPGMKPNPCHNPSRRRRFRRNPSHIRPLPRNPHAAEYSERIRLRGYNGPVSVLTAHGSDAGKILRKLHPEATKEEHLSLAKKYKTRGDVLYRAYGNLLNRAARETWGREWRTSDYTVSGIGSDAFSPRMKERLRKANREMNLYYTASHAHQYAAGRRSIV